MSQILRHRHYIEGVTGIPMGEASLLLSDPHASQVEALKPALWSAEILGGVSPRSQEAHPGIRAAVEAMATLPTPIHLRVHLLGVTEKATVTEKVGRSSGESTFNVFLLEVSGGYAILHMVQEDSMVTLFPSSDLEAEAVVVGA